MSVQRSAIKALALALCALSQNTGTHTHARTHALAHSLTHLLTLTGSRQKQHVV